MAGRVKEIAELPSETEKEELLSKLYWCKQLLGILLGLAAGLLKLQGFPVILGFLVLVGATSLFYSWQVQHADDVEGWDILSEAMAPTFFIFMLSWVLSFSFL